MIHIKPLLRTLALAAGLCLTHSALAASDIAQIEVLDGGQTADGTHMAGLRITLAPGWKTYWRSPGDAGIPPEFAWNGSRNIDGVSVAWPTPVAFEQSGMRSIGYMNSVVFPLEVTPAQDGQPLRLSGRLDLGICKDVCVPAELSFDATLDPNAKRSPAIAAALANRPYSEREAGVRAMECAISPTEDGLRLETRITMPSSGGAEVAVIEAGNPAVWASEAETSRAGNVLTAVSELMHVDARPFALDRSKVRVTVLGSKYAVDIQGCTAG